MVSGLRLCRQQVPLTRPNASITIFEYVIFILFRVLILKFQTGGACAAPG
jgi:hypothetical protein